MKKMKISLFVFTLVFSVSQISAFGFGAWGGWNFPTYEESSDCKDSTGVTCTKGGLSFGGDLWLLGFGPVQLGAGAAYLPIQDKTTESTTLGVTYKTTSKTAYIPVTATLRVDIPFVGIYGLAGAGLGVGLASAETTSNGTSVPTDAKANTSFTVLFGLGKSISLIPLLSLDVGARYYYIPAKTEEPTQGSVTSTEDKKFSNLLITLGVTLKI